MSESRRPAKFVVTGPTGWIGRALLAQIAADAGPGDLSGRVLAFGSREGRVDLPDGGAVPIAPLETITAADVEGAHVVHLAYLTREKVAVVGEDAFRDTNEAIDNALMGALEQVRPASLFVASSGAAAQAALGLYGVGKLLQEQRFLTWAERSGTPTVAGRIFNIAGPWINKLDAYAVSNFAVQALRHGQVRIEADRPVFRSFLHVADLCSLVIGAAIKGVRRDRAIDLCGAQAVEMHDIAAAVLNTLGCPAAIVRGQVDLAKPAAYLGNPVDTAVLAMEVGVELASFAKQIGDTLDWIKSSWALEGMG